MRQLRLESHADMSSMRNDLKRHTEVLFESLRDDIRIIAEGVVSLDAKTRSLDARVERLDTKVDRLVMKIESVDARMESLLPPDRVQ
jgi:predicted nuclease with TOPRIM domain